MFITKLSLHIHIFTASNLTLIEQKFTYYSCYCKLKFYFQAEDTHNMTQNSSCRMSFSGKGPSLFKKDKQRGQN
jgi:hypothetical protein